MSLLEYSEEVTQLNLRKRSIHRCKTCKFWTTSIILMVNHVRRHIQGLQPFNCQNPVETFYCSYCEFATHLTMVFKKHLRENHVGVSEVKDIELYRCKNCDFMSYFALDLLKHASNGCVLSSENEESKKVSSDPQMLKDESIGREQDENHNCDNDFESQLKLNHVKETKSRWWNCDKCDYKSKRKNDFDRHKISKHLKDEEIQWFRCDNCDYKAKIKTNLGKHKRRIHLNKDEIKWCKCEKCDYKSKATSDLRRHVKRRHQNLVWVKKKTDLRDSLSSNL